MEIVLNNDMSVVQKRKKPTLVCENCRKKKIRCDKGEPCTPCLKADLVHSCIYESSQQRSVKLPYVKSAREPLQFDDVPTKTKKVARRVEKVAKPSNEHKFLSIPKENQKPKDIVLIPISKLKDLQNQIARLESIVKSDSYAQVTPCTDSPDSTKLSPIYGYYNIHQRSVSNEVSDFNQTTFPFKIPPKAKASLDDIKAIIGVHPYASKTDFISFYDGYCSMHVTNEHRTINFGPFAWPSVMSKDPALKILWDTITKKPLVSECLPSNQNSKNLKADATSQQNNEQAFKIKAYTDSFAYANFSNNVSKILGLRDGSSTYKPSKIIPLIDRINQLLPNRKMIWILVNRFFDSLYLLAPIIDEEVFRQNIEKVIGKESDTDTTVKLITDGTDLPYVGILFAIFRLSFLSFLYNSTAANLKNKTTVNVNSDAYDVKYILEHPIKNEASEIVKAIFEQFHSVQNVTIPMIQLVIFMKVKAHYDPVESDQAGIQNQTLHGVIAQMAYQLGLNREPDALHGALVDIKVNNVRRKLWWMIVLWDINAKLKLGSPLIINHDAWDTKYPYHVPGNESIRDKLQDARITERLGLIAHSLSSLNRILDMVLNFSKRANIAQLCGDLNIFERKLYREFDSFQICIDNIPTESKNIGLFHHFTANHCITRKRFLQSIYFHLAFYYEFREPKISFFYLKKLLLMICGDFMPTYFQVFENDIMCCDMVLNPALINLIDKSILLFKSSIIRANALLYSLRNSDKHVENYKNDENYRKLYQLCCLYSANVTRCMEITLIAISRLSHRYYHAWRIVKAQCYVIRLITREDFYVQTAASPIETRNKNIDELEELIAITNISLNALNPILPPKDMKLYSVSTNEFEVENNINYNNINNINLLNTREDHIPVPCLKAKDNVDTLDARQIDNLWLQMLNDKSFNPVPPQDILDDGAYSTYENLGSLSAFPGTSSFHVDNSSDVFNDLSLDQIFNYGNV